MRTETQNSAVAKRKWELLGSDPPFPCSCFDRVRTPRLEDRSRVTWIVARSVLNAQACCFTAVFWIVLKTTHWSTNRASQPSTNQFMNHLHEMQRTYSHFIVYAKDLLEGRNEIFLINGAREVLDAVDVHNNCLQCTDRSLKPTYLAASKRTQ